MSASLNDKVTDVRNAARPNSARATGTRSTGGASLACDSLAGWPTASKVHFVTYQIDSSSEPVAGTQLDCYGIVSGNSITSFTVVDGSDTGNIVGDVVEMLPTAAWGQDLADALMSQHKRSGTHADTITTDTINENTSAHGVTIDGVNIKDGALTTTGSVTPAIISNPYGFSAYRSAAFTDGNSAYALVTFDTENFDTGSNYDTSTGKYTAPVAGFYQFNANISVNYTGGNYIGVAFHKNGTRVSIGNFVAGGGSGSTLASNGVSAYLQLAANDYVQVYHFGTGGAGQTGSDLTNFSGFLVNKT